MTIRYRAEAKEDSPSLTRTHEAFFSPWSQRQERWAARKSEGGGGGGGGGGPFEKIQYKSFPFSSPPSLSVFVFGQPGCPQAPSFHPLLSFSSSWTSPLLFLLHGSTLQLYPPFPHDDRPPTNPPRSFLCEGERGKAEGWKERRRAEGGGISSQKAGRSVGRRFSVRGEEGKVPPKVQQHQKPSPPMVFFCPSPGPSPHYLMPLTPHTRPQPTFTLLLS